MLTLFFCVSVAGCSATQDDVKAKYSKGQQLVIAAFELDVDGVKGLLAEGVDPDTRLGFYDDHLFEDKWTLGYSDIGSDKWTPLLAVAHSHREPQPDRHTENTITGRDNAMAKLKSIDSKLISERDSRRVAIARLLIKAKANTDLDDGYGGTALSASVYSGYDVLSLLLISSNAKIDTKTGVYIDGDGDITPMHRATNSPKVLQAMIKRGAKVNVADTSGDTPLHWAVRDRNVESVKLLLEAGANVTAIDNEGRSPSYWCKTYDGINSPEDAEKMEISRLLDAEIKESQDRTKR
ncbi:MAG: ankyrin repeat domain-containing protein [Pirellula sp.]